jgi:mono/diheme cytochrome c family protein
MAKMIQAAGFGDQPNVFDSATIESEVNASCPTQPALNTPTGKSATWQAAYDAAVAGQYIAAPYHDVKVTDPTKLAKMTAAYQQFKAGTLMELPDLREVFLDEGLRDMSFAPKANLTGKQLVVQMCQQCHHSNLDLTISREKFLVDQLDTMSREEKDLAIERINMPVDTRLSMPPALFRTMTDAERQAMIDELKK